MATVNKDFKVKNGLIVEGTTGTINNYDILTKKTDDQSYIVNLIGGTATSANEANKVVKRDGSGNFAAGTITANLVGNVTGNADTASELETARKIELTGDVTGSVFFDGAANVQISTTLNGSFATDAEVSSAIATEVTNRNSAIATSLATAESYADDAAGNALDAANAYTDSSISTEVTNRNSAIATAKSQAISTSEAYTDSAISTEVTNRNSAIATAKSQAISTSESYTDTAITNLNLAGTYDALGAAASALADANEYTDGKVSDLVNSAPALLDTLGELATALQNNPDIISDLQDIAAGKQDTLQTGNGIVIDDNLIYIPTYIGSGVSITPSIVEIDREVVDDWYDANGAAATAQNAAEDYADTVAGSAQSAAQSYTDSAISTEVTNRNSAIATAKSQAISTAEGYTDTAISTEVSNRNSAITSAIATEVTNRNSAIATAKSEAISTSEGYTDNAINALDTDDIEEGTINKYFTDNRAKDAAGYLLENSTQSNISISYNEGTRQLTVTAENGVADSTTDDLDEGATNLYFTTQRALDALDMNNPGIAVSMPQFTEVTLNLVAKQVAASAAVATASTVNAYTWAKADYRSAKFLVKFETATHSEISEVLITLDGSDNVAITEYAIVGTNGNLGNVTADVSGSDVRLRVTTINNNTDVMVMGTLLV